MSVARRSRSLPPVPAGSSRTASGNVVARKRLTGGSGDCVGGADGLLGPPRADGVPAGRDAHRRSASLLSTVVQGKRPGSRVGDPRRRYRDRSATPGSESGGPGAGSRTPTRGAPRGRAARPGPDVSFTTGIRRCLDISSASSPTLPSVPPPPGPRSSRPSVNTCSTRWPPSSSSAGNSPTAPLRTSVRGRLGGDSKV